MDELRPRQRPRKPVSDTREALEGAALQNAPHGMNGDRRSPGSRRRAAEALGIDVARRLEQLIIDGILRPGERLNEVGLARSLGVSRGPVREAARALEKTGLVTVIMNRGAFVRSLALDEAMQIYEVNAVLFGLAAGNAAGTLNATQASTLRGMVQGMDSAIARDDREAFFRLNSNFHACILALGRNAEAQALYGQFTRKLMLLRRRSFEMPGHMQEANREHRKLMEAILAGDGARARGLAEAHARLGRNRFLGAIGHDEGIGTSKMKEILP